MEGDDHSGEHEARGVNENGISQVMLRALVIFNSVSSTNQTSELQFLKHHTSG